VRPIRSLFFAAVLSLVLIALAGARLQPAGAASTELFFSEYMEGTSNNKALEIFNGTGSPVNLTTGLYSVAMYFNGSTSPGTTINLNGTVQPNDVFVLAHSLALAEIRARADQQSSASWYNGNDAVALMKGAAVVDVIGQIGLDPGTEWGTGLTSTADNTLRRKSTILAGDTNAADAFDPAAEWDGFATNDFENLGSHSTGGGQRVIANCGAGPLATEEGTAATRSVSATDADGQVASLALTSVTPTPAAGSIALGNVVPASTVGGTATGDVTVNASVPAGTYQAEITATNEDTTPASASCTLAVSVVHVYAIHEVQGAGHTSPFAGQAVSLQPATVYALRSNGFYTQDPNADADPNTSEGIFVFGSTTGIGVGDSVKVSGNVAEFRPGATGLTITEITGPTVQVLSTGNQLPAATVIGAGGRTPPDTVIDNDSFAAFDPAQDGIDFYETLEGMRTGVSNPVVVGPTNGFGEVWVLADDGAGAAVRSVRDGILVRPTDFNPERVMLDDGILGSMVGANVGDHFVGSPEGAMNYDFGNYRIELTQQPLRIADGVTREVTATPEPKELSVATFNVENLGGNEAQAKYDALAGQIVERLRAPDVIALEEIQDNNGTTGGQTNTEVAADLTLSRLIAAIQGARGPTYEYRQINPVANQDGGAPGGNIRVGFLFRTDRGLAFVDRAEAGEPSTTGTTIVAGTGGKPQLSRSPGRISPGATAWNASRKPLAGEFTFRGRTFFLIANHFNSKTGDQPLYGRNQPPSRPSETQRAQQAQLVNDFADSILGLDPNASIVVLGDLNDFEFSNTLTILKGGVLQNLMDTLPASERYSYVFEGNSQVLDQIVVSPGLGTAPLQFDPVRVNSEFFDQLSDHDPSVARYFVNTSPSLSAGGPYAVDEGSSITLTANGSDAEGDALTYDWDLDDNGTFETAGQSATYSAVDGPATPTVKVRVSDGTASATATTTVSIANVPPTATLSAPASSNAGFSFTLSLTGATDASAPDRAAGFAYAFDCGDGYGVFSSAASTSCTPLDTGALTVHGKLRDQDGDVREYTASITVGVTFQSLCDLVRAYTSDAKTRETLCKRLQLASVEPGAAAAQLQVFRKDVDKAEADGFLTATEAGTLRRLSTRL
jgi:predicted extracellular nuclease